MNQPEEKRAAAPPEPAPEAPALFRRFPELAARIAWLPLASAPTPVQRLPLERAGAELWAKRDDLSGARYGGNKVRKLEFILARARAEGARRVVTGGAAGSHHALATTVYARGLGLDVSLALFPQSLTPHVRRVLLQDHLLGAELRWVSHIVGLPLALWNARRAHAADHPVAIPPGGSDPVGTLGYVSGALELAEQVEGGSMPAPDTIHVAAGTLGTTAGLAIGLALAGLPTRIAAVRITPPIVTNTRVLRKLVRGTAAVLEQAGIAVPVESALGRVDLVHGFFGAGYGQATPEGEAAAEVLARIGLQTDPTYTAKAAAGTLAGIDAPGVHLFWHTLSATEPFETIPDHAERGLPEPFRRYLAGERV